MLCNGNHSSTFKSSNISFEIKNIMTFESFDRMLLLSPEIRDRAVSKHETASR